MILILDEFDALPEKIINGFVGVFRNIYNSRTENTNPSGEKEYLLHAVALIGVRSVLGVENKTGPESRTTPFNVQRSLSIPNLTYEETKEMFHWYEKESGQKVEEEVIGQIYSNTCGQPGLTSWFGELLTETYALEKDQAITMEHWKLILRRAISSLPNINVINIISKAKQEPYRETVLELFKTEEKLLFRFEEPKTNFLYMNGVVEQEETKEAAYLKFSCPFAVTQGENMEEARAMIKEAIQLLLESYRENATKDLTGEEIWFTSTGFACPYGFFRMNRR